MERFKVLLVIVVVVVSTVLAVARFLVTEIHDFWEFLWRFQW
jgi:hypothetical protein